VCDILQLDNGDYYCYRQDYKRKVAHNQHSSEEEAMQALTSKAGFFWFCRKFHLGRLWGMISR
jgi:hypothetical protein